MNQEFAVCNLSLVPLRAEASDKAEMSSQLVFGDHFEILDRTEKWLRIRTGYDEYEGWVDHKQCLPVTKETYLKLHDLNTVMGTRVSHEVETASREVLHLVAGSNLPDLDEEGFQFENTRYSYAGQVVKPDASRFAEDIETTALFYLNAPYLWGGRSVFGIDCSGFCQMVYRQFGIRLKRDAWQQAGQGRVVDFLGEVQPGDLAFFDNEEGRITHVGLMLSPEKIIHASGRVKIEAIDNQGIYSTELQRYTHKLRIIKRLTDQSRD